MITRAKLVEQLRDYQIQSQHKWGALSFFSPKLQIATRQDVVVALSWTFLFCLFMISSSLSLYFRNLKTAVVIICFAVLLPTILKISRQRKLSKKRERRMLLPLSM